MAPSPRSRRGSHRGFLVAGPRGIRHPSPRHAAAFLGLVVAARRIEARLDDELRAAHGIGLRPFEILLHLAAFSPDGRLRMAQLTQQAPLSQSRVSRIVAELEAAGLVTRAGQEGDARAVVVSITDRGLDALREAQDTHHRGLEAHLFSRLTDEQVDALAEIASRLLADGGG